MTRLSEIRARLEKATPGPWDIYFATGEGPCIVRYKEVGEYREIVEDVIPLYLRREKDEPNAQLIAHAPSDLRFLLAERDRLAAEVERLTKVEVTEADVDEAFDRVALEAKLDAALGIVGKLANLGNCQCHEAGVCLICEARAVIARLGGGGK